MDTKRILFSAALTMNLGAVTPSATAATLTTVFSGPSALHGYSMINPAVSTTLVQQGTAQTFLDDQGNQVAFSGSADYNFRAISFCGIPGGPVLDLYGRVDTVRTTATNFTSDYFFVYADLDGSAIITGAAGQGSAVWSLVLFNGCDLSLLCGSNITTLPDTFQFNVPFHYHVRGVLGVEIPGDSIPGAGGRNNSGFTSPFLYGRVFDASGQQVVNAAFVDLSEPTPIPEPSTLAVVALGALTLSLKRAQKQATAC